MIATTTEPGEAPPRISDYAILGNCRVCALVSRAGSIDWLCLPEPDSPSVFAALLDPRRGGCWSVRPEGIREVTRRYLDRTGVLETTYRCASGVVRVTDVLQVGSPATPAPELEPDVELSRRIEGVEGSVDVQVRMSPRPGYASRRPRLRDAGRFGIVVEGGAQSILVRSDLTLHVDGAGGEIRADRRVEAGEVLWMALGQTADGPQIAPMLGPHAEARLRRTVTWWRRWAEGCAGPPVDDELVMRSAIVLKSLMFSPTGAVLAAPTTSLPEEIGGERNWDYRYCWIRDASFTMRALLGLGLHDEAEGFFAWLLHATRLTRPRLRVLYDIHGRAGPRERTLDHLAGYRGSRPVRIGNGARNQLQLDTYGALLDAAWQFHRSHQPLGSEQARMLRSFVHTAQAAWRRPDSGIWEIRAGTRHHTLSKAMCWVAMDRGLRLARDGVMKLDEDRVQADMAEVRAEVEREGFNEALGAYTARFGGDTLDASLLLLGIYGFERADSPRMQGTIDRIIERLGDGPALHRYVRIDDGVAGREGRFGICGFWGVEALARAGRVEEARRSFTQLVRYANDVGLFAEEVDVEDGRALGNFPQALTHVGVINAARALAGAGDVDPAVPAGQEAG